MTKIDFIKDTKDLPNKLNKSLDVNSFVTVYTRCVVDYSGRTSTDLKEGDRCILLKPDGVISVQSGEGLRPKNWQPPGGDFNFYHENDTLVIECIREESGKEEVVKVYCLEHYGTTIYNYQDDKEIEMIGSEDDMHDKIMEKPELIEKGFKALKNEKKTKVGDIDIYGKDNQDNVVVIEVKRRKAELKHVDQLSRYTEFIRNNVDEKARGILVAPEASDNTIKQLKENRLELVKLDPLEISDSVNNTTEKTRLNDYKN